MIFRVLLSVGLVKGFVDALRRRQPIIVDGWRLAALTFGDGHHDDGNHIAKAIRVADAEVFISGCTWSVQ